MALIVLFPFYWMIISSLKSLDEYRASVPTFWPRMVLISNYADAFSTGNLGRLFLNTAYVGIVSTMLSLIITILTAFAFARLEFKGKNALFGALLATMMIPTQVTMIPLFVVMNQMGLINHYASVILPSVFKPFAVFMLVQQMRTIPPDYMDAARIDGAGVWRIWRQVTLPLCAPALATLAVTNFMDSWNDYLWPLLMLTDKAKMTLPIALSTLNGQYDTEYNVMMAGSLISMIPIILIYIFAQKYFKHGLMAGGVKG